MYKFWIVEPFEYPTLKSGFQMVVWKLDRNSTDMLNPHYSVCIPMVPPFEFQTQISLALGWIRCLGVWFLGLYYIEKKYTLKIRDNRLTNNVLEVSLKNLIYSLTHEKWYLHAGGFGKLPPVSNVAVHVCCDCIPNIGK